MCGFSRRFDASYRDAYNKMSSGALGAPSVIRSQTCDKLDPTGFFVAYAEFSGGIFVDCSIHDIDLSLWFFGQDSKVRSVSAVGITAVEPDLRKHNDRDNAVGLVEFYDGKMAYFYASRMMAAGQEDTSEFIGTKGKVTVNAQPQLNLVQTFDAGGIKKEIPQHYYDRFEYDGGERVHGIGFVEHGCALEAGWCCPGGAHWCCAAGISDHGGEDLLR